MFHLKKKINKIIFCGFVYIYYIYEHGKYSKGVIPGHNFVSLAMYYNMEIGINNLYIYVKLRGCIYIKTLKKEIYLF